MRAKLLRLLYALRREIDGNHAATRRAGHLNGQHSHQAGADDGHRLAESNSGLAQTLRGNGADGGQRRRIGGHIVGDADCQIAGTKFTSQWLAYPAPAQATRSPMLNSAASAPTAMTSPAQL